MWPFDEMIDATNYLIVVVLAVPALILYGFQSVFLAFVSPMIASINLLIALLNLPIQTGNTLITVFTVVLVDIMPQQAISYVLLAQIVVVILFRLYHFASHISIAGFKI